MDDDAILAEVESCWTILADAIDECCPDLEPDRIETDARRIVELLVFLRMGEDRGVVPVGTLRRLAAEIQSGVHLVNLVQRLEGELGQGLIQVESDGPSSESARAEPWPERIESGRFIEVTGRLSETGLMSQAVRSPVELMGSIHQHLLGKRLRVEVGGRYRVETSTERRKAAGVFYTPDCVIRYVVANVLGKESEEGRPPDAAVDGRLLDPACGCGWFLLSAYRFLAEKLELPGHGGSAADLLKRIGGVDLDPGAVLAARRSLWLEVVRGKGKSNRQAVAAILAANIRCGDALAGPMLDRAAGQFSAVIGNPPYHRELNGKALLERIGATEFGRRWREPRMDLWYYFVHRGLELLEPEGRLSFIVASYWTSGSGARKLIDALGESAHVNEIFSLDGLAVFPDVSGRHMILTLTKGKSSSPTLIKAPSPGDTDRAEPYLSGRAPLIVFQKTPAQLFRDGRIDLEPPCDELLARLGQLARLEDLGVIRQGIADNPARVTRKAVREHGGRWQVGDGVFALTAEELAQLKLSAPERGLIRPYYRLSDLGRFYLAAEASGVLIYSTAQTCPDVDRFPAIRDHLARFRPIMESRRETRRGTRAWWQLHWPREDRLWESPKLISLQMARRPSFVAASSPVYVPFSANVFVPNSDIEEHLDYFAAVLNSRLIWKWYRHHAKRRGIGLDLSGHALRRTPVRRIDFSDRADLAKHDRLVELAGRLMGLSRRLRADESGREAELKDEFAQADAEIDSLVYDLYGLGEREVKAVEMSTRTTEDVAANRPNVGQVHC